MTVLRLPAAFSTERLSMRPFEFDDADSVYAYASDPSVTKFMEWPTHKDVNDSLAYIEAVKKDADPDSEMTWAITLAATNQLIGAASCRPDGHQASFGYIIARPCWGQGFATEVARRIVALLEANPTIRRVWATCDVENAGSAKVLENAGLVREGTLHERSTRPNLPGEPLRDSFIYARTSTLRHA